MDKATQEAYSQLPSFEHNPPMPQELEELSPLQREFWIQMHPKAPSPYFLAEHPLNTLVRLKEDEMHKLCRFLALFDLYQEMKNVVQTKLVKSIKECLDNQEWHFLESVRHLQNTVHLPKMNLGAWDQGKESLDQALFERGKTRLKGALSSAYETLYPFLPETFIPKEKKPSKEITEVLLKQVETVLNRAFTYVKHH